MTITEFLTARLDEDEVAATALVPSETWTQIAPGVTFWQATGNSIDVNMCSFGSAHAAVSVDRDHVWAEVDAKRQIISEHRIIGDGRCETCVTAIQDDWIFANWPCRTLRLLALPYANHPDYSEEWRP